MATMVKGTLKKVSSLLQEPDCTACGGVNCERDDHNGLMYCMFCGEVTGGYSIAVNGEQ